MTTDRHVFQVLPRPVGGNQSTAGVTTLLYSAPFLHCERTIDSSRTHSSRRSSFDPHTQTFAARPSAGVLASPVALPPDSVLSEGTMHLNRPQPCMRGGLSTTLTGVTFRITSITAGKRAVRMIPGRRYPPIDSAQSTGCSGAVWPLTDSLINRRSWRCPQGREVLP